MTQSLTPYQMVAAFHETFDPRKPDQPTALPKAEVCYRAGFQVEELVELLFAAASDHEDFAQSVAGLQEAIRQAQAKVLKKAPAKQKKDELVEQVDALTDLLYLTYGSFALMGVDPDPIFAIVHQANMGKLFPDGQPHYDPVTNKVLKPEDWQENYAPEGKIAAELQRQTQLAQQVTHQTPS